MISVGNRDGGRKGLTEHGFKRWMKDETELEEGEACSFHDDDDDDEGSIDPDLALSYLDEKLQNVLGHFQKDFEGVVSAENLGAKYGIYGSFLPSYRRSPVWSHPSPQSVQNHNTSHSSNPLQVEGGNHTSLSQTSVPQSLKHGSASTSSYANKPPSQSGLCRQTATTQSIKSLEGCTPKSEALDQRTLKVRIKVGSDNLSVKKNDAIYNGLGLVGSPSSSFDGSPAESEGLSQGLPCESPTQIVQIMSSFPLIGGHLLSPLPDDIIQLSGRTKLLNYIRTQPSSFMTNHESLVMGHPCYSVKDNKIFPGENGTKILNRKGSPLKMKRESGDRCTAFDFSFKETDIDAASCEKLVSSALKLPLLSDAYDIMEDSVKKTVKEEEVYNAEKLEPLEPFPIPVGLSCMSSGIGDATNSSTNTERVGLKVKKASKGGFRDHAKQKVDKPSSSGNGTVLAHGNAQFSSREKKKSKRSQSHSSSSKKASTQSANDRAMAMKNKQGSDEAYACKSELGDSPLRKESRKASDKNSKVSDTYKDFFGDINDQELDVGDSPYEPSGDRLKASELIEDTLKDKESNPVAHKRTISETNIKGLSRSAGISEKGQPISDAVSDTQDKWVCCDKCQAWRLLPPGSNEESLPDKWDCTMLTWLPGMNRCGISDDETTTAVRVRYQMLAETSNSLLVPPDRRATGMISAYNLYPSMRNDEKIVEKVRKTPKSSFQANQPKKVDQHKSDSDSGRGLAKISKINRKTERDEEFPRDSKKSKKRVTQSKDNDPATEHYQDGDMMVSPSFSLATNTPSNEKMPNLELFSLQKSDMGGDSPDTSDKKFQVEGLPAVASLHVNKSGSGIVAPRKRKVDNFQHPANSTPSSGKLISDHNEISPKKRRTSKSEGKESSFSNQNEKVEKRSKSSSRQSLKNTESLQKDPLCALPAVAATSSSSKISGSLRIKPKFQELKGSPVESVSSSPYRISNSVKLTPGSKIKVEKDSVDRLEPREHTSDRCLNEVNGDDGHHKIVSHPGKNEKDCSSPRKDKSMKSIDDKGNVKMSESYGNPYDYGPISEEKKMDGKFKIPETTASTVDKPDKIGAYNNQGSSTLKSKAHEDYDPKRSSKKFDVDKYEQLVSISGKEKSNHLLASDGEKNEKSNSLRSNEGNGTKTCSSDARASDRQKEVKSNRKANTQNGTHHVPYNRPISNGHSIKNQDAPSPLRRDVTSQAAGNAIKEAKNLKHLADRLKRDTGSTESTGYYFEAALKFLHGASLLESGKTENTKHADMVQSTKIYSDTAKLCGFCAHEYEKCKDMATAALAYKCMEVAYLRVIYSSHHSATRDRHELQTVLHMVPPGESPSSSASDIDNLNNSATVDKDPQVRNGGSPQLTPDLVITANNRPRFERLLNFAQGVNFAMEASRKSRTAFEAANIKMDKGDSKEVMTSIKRALDFNFHDVHGLLRLIRVAKEATSR